MLLRSTSTTVTTPGVLRGGWYFCRPPIRSAPRSAWYGNCDRSRSEETGASSGRGTVAPPSQPPAMSGRSCIFLAARQWGGRAATRRSSRVGRSGRPRRPPPARPCSQGAGRDEWSARHLLLNKHKKFFFARSPGLAARGRSDIDGLVFLLVHLAFCRGSDWKELESSSKLPEAISQ